MYGVSVVWLSRCEVVVLRTLANTFRPENIDVIFLLLNKRRWLSGTILACHAGGPGSIPGRRSPFEKKCL